MILGICDNPDILKVIYLVKMLIKAIQIIVPIIMIVVISKDFANVMIKGDAPAELINKVKYRAIAAVAIFLVPLIVDVILTATGEEIGGLSSCWSNAELATIEDFQIKHDQKVKEDLEKEKEEQDKIKQEQQEQQKQESISSEYNDTNSHKNSINGVRYMLYNQADPKWGSVTYPSGKTIAAVGCLITSTAVVSSAADSSVTPYTVFNNGARHQYPYTGVIHSTGSEWFSCKMGSITYDNIINELKKGNAVVIKVEEASAFTSSQHYMALIDISSDGKKIFVGNSYASGGYGRNGWFDAGVVLTDVHEFNICTPTKKLIDKFN